MSTWRSRFPRRAERAGEDELMTDWDVALLIKRSWDALPISVHLALTALVPLLAVWLTCRKRRS